MPRPRSTRAQTKALGTAYTSLYKARGAIGGSATRIESIKEQIRRDRERREERLTLLGQVVRLGSEVSTNIERQRMMEAGAGYAGIKLPERGFLEKLRTTFLGPHTEERYGQQGISGGMLTSIGQTARDFPGMAPAMVEMAQRFQSFTGPVPTTTFGPQFEDENKWGLRTPWRQ